MISRWLVFSPGKKDADDGSADQVDIPKRTTPAKGESKRHMKAQRMCDTHNQFLKSLFLPGYELLFQPEVVRVYTSLLRESKNPSVLEAAAGAIQNLCAGRWTVSGQPLISLAHLSLKSPPPFASHCLIS